MGQRLACKEQIKKERRNQKKRRTEKEKVKRGKDKENKPPTVAVQSNQPVECRSKAISDHALKPILKCATKGQLSMCNTTSDQAPVIDRLNLTTRIMQNS